MTTASISHPDNPHHVANLASIPLLEAQGFEGPDRCLATSLFEYGLVWRKLDGEVLFVHNHPTIPHRFDRTTLKSDLDSAKEWNWANLSRVAENVGMSLTEWLAQPIERRVYDMVIYHGVEETFDSSYWEGFEIAED